MLIDIPFNNYIDDESKLKEDYDIDIDKYDDVYIPIYIDGIIDDILADFDTINKKIMDTLIKYYIFDNICKCDKSLLQLFKILYGNNCDINCKITKNKVNNYTYNFDTILYIENNLTNKTDVYRIYNSYVNTSSNFSLLLCEFWEHYLNDDEI